MSLERFDVIDGTLTIVMELAERNLWDRFRECRGQGRVGIPREELLRYLEEAAEALDLMNDHYNIQHLDVKPQNLFLMYNHIKVADFGLAKDFEGEQGEITGGVTPVYAAPETFEGYVSRFTDQYSLAIVYQELLTGRRSFDGSNTKHLMHQHLTGVPDLSSLPEADRPTIRRALSKRPDERWPNCAEMVRALRDPRRPAPEGETPAELAPEITPPSFETPPPAGVPRAPATALATKARAPLAPPAPRPAPGAPPNGAAPKRPSGPVLITPRLVTQQSLTGSNLMAPATLSRDQVLQTGRMSDLGLAGPEVHGEGVLFPALVVGVGATGLAVLKTLRGFVREQFGAPDALSTIRYLYLDTDPEAPALAAEGPDGLSPREVVVARLNRPTHYLQQAALPAVDQWLPPGFLYRLPKNPSAAGGVRAFGRLALCDYYPQIRQRIQQELEQFLTDDAVQKAGKATGLGVRGNRVKAYVLAGLAGGTGSGMALDLAYILKHELRSIGYRSPETVGVLLAPPADALRGPSGANTVAALTELHHYSSGGRYQARFDAKEAPLTDPAAPFARTHLFALPKALKPREQRAAFALAARGLYLELLTTAGRRIDHVRREAALAERGGGASVQAYGLHRLSWPRAELLTETSRRFAAQVLERWGGREAAHLRDPLSAWLDQLWAKQGLSTDALAARFRASVQGVLGDSPESVFSAFVETLRTRSPGSAKLDAQVACQVLDQLIQFVGKPAQEQSPPGSLAATIKAEAAKIDADAQNDLSTLAVNFIEQPQYRLAGAESALSLLEEKLAGAVEALEPRVAEADREVLEHFSRLMHLIGFLGSPSTLGAIPGRKASLAADLLDALQAYPSARLRHTELSVALSLYRGLLGAIPEFVRDVSYCRARLLKMQDAFGAAESGRVDAAGIGTLVLPPGCKTLEDAANRLLGALPPDEILAFDTHVQGEIRRKFRGLASVCLKEARTDEFTAFLGLECRAFIDERLERTDSATMLLRYRGQGGEFAELLRKAFEGAAPKLALAGGHAPLEAAILATPDGPSAAILREAASAACAGDPFIAAPLADDIVVWREWPRVPLSALAHFAGAGAEGYRTQSGGDHSPHARIDVPWPRVASG